MKDLSKRYLVTPEEYQRIKSPSSRFDSKPYSIPHPDAKNAAKTHSTLKDILSSENVSDFDKVLGYTQSLQRYLSDLKNAVSVPKATAILGKPQKTQSSPPPPPPPSPQPNLIDINFETTNTDNLDAFNTPARNSLSDSFVPSKLNFTNPQEYTTPPTSNSKSNNSKKKRKDKAGSFSQEKIVERADSLDQAKLNNIFQRLSDIPQVSWNKTTGIPTIGGQTLSHTTIEALANEYIANKSATSGSRTFKKFQRILDGDSPKTSKSKK